MFDASLDPEHDIQRQWAQELLSAVSSGPYRSLVDAIERRDHDAAHEALDGAVLEFRTFMMGIIAPGHSSARQAATHSRATKREQRKPADGGAAERMFPHGSSKPLFQHPIGAGQSPETRISPRRYSAVMDIAPTAINGISPMNVLSSALWIDGSST
jgi:hypothetical protein